MIDLDAKLMDKQRECGGNPAVIDREPVHEQRVDLREFRI